VNVYILLSYYSIIEVVGLVGRYAKLWFEVHRIVSRAQKDVYGVVEEMCRLLVEDVGGFLEGLRREYGFTYVIEPLQGNSDIMRCVPCLFVDGDAEVFKTVERMVRERFPEVVSESRLVFERRPRGVSLE